jgi:methylenetetrahydrofolate reductase (NADPH)
MEYSDIHPNWDREPAYITEGFSVEITAKDVEGLREAAPMLPPDTPVAVTFLPGEALEARLAAAKEVRSLGFEPMPHFSARRIKSEADFKSMVERMVAEAGVKRCFAIAGDPPQPEGPYSETANLIETGIFEANGIRAIGIAGHPQGHPNMTEDECFTVLEKKCAMIVDRGMKPLIVTQFGFDPDAFLQWLVDLRKRGIDAPVRIGVPGPTSIKALLKFAARCGVEASASVMSKYGISITNLLGSAGPDKMVNAFASGFSGAHGRVRLHFYPFGGLAKTAEWITKYNKKHSNVT